MKNLITYLSKKSLSLGNGSGMTRKWFGNGSGMTRFSLASLICLCMLTVGVGQMWGSQYVYVCNTNANWWTTSGGATNVSYDAAFSTTRYYTDGTAWSGSGTNCCLKSGYFFLGKTDAYLTLPTFSGEKITSVVIQASNGHSTSVKVNIMNSSGTAVSTVQTWSSTGQIHAYAIGSSYQASTLRIQVTNNYNTQFTSITINTVPNSSCAGTQLAMPDVTATPSSGQIQLSWPAVTNATKYQVSWNGGTFIDATSPYTKTSLTNSTTYTWAVRAVGNGSTYCNSEINEGSTKPNSTIRTVTWKVGTTTHATTKVASGDHLVLPESPTPCMDGKIFAGWSASTIDGTTNTKPTFVSSQTTISSNQTYYAVFATPTANSYTKGDINDLFPGQTVLIVNETNSKALSDEYVSSYQNQRLQKVDVSISSNTITSMSNSHATWTVENMGQKYYFKTGTGYLRAATVGNGNLSCNNVAADPWTLTDASSGQYYMNSNGSATSRVEYYSSYFTTYGTNATGNEYKMTFFVPTCTQYFTTCTAPCDAPTGLSNGSITVSGVTFTVTDANDANKYDFYYNTSSTLPTSGTTPSTNVSGSKSKSVTGLAYGTKYYSWARTECSGPTKSSWYPADASSYFTTLAPQPTSITAGTLKPTSATFTIVDSNSPAQWDIYYSTSSTAPTGSTVPTTTTTNKSKDVTGLTAGTTYYYWVRGHGANANSAWLAGSGNTFTTPTLSSITISTGPTKTTYFAGEYFDPTGLVIQRNYSNSTNDTYTYAGHTAEFSFSPATNVALTTSDEAVTITYGTKTVNQAINVYSVTMTKVDEDEETISAAGVSASWTVGTKALAASATAGSKYVFKEWAFDGSNNGLSITSTSSANTTVTGTPTGNVTIKAVFYKPRVVKWSVNGNDSYNTGSPTSTIAYNKEWKDLKLPTDPTPPCGDKFMGWTTTNIGSTGLDVDDDASEIADLDLMTSGNKSEKTGATGHYITDATVTFYAVFADYDE